MEEATASTSTTMVSLSDEVLNQIAVKAATISSNLLTRNNQQMCDFMENSLREKEKYAKTLKNAVNQQQYDHARECLATLETAEKHLAREEVTNATEVLNNGKVLIKKRMKLIRLADCNTWATVQEYVSDDLASDTDDDKHNQKSIRAAAARKGKAKLPRKFRNAPLPYRTERLAQPPRYHHYQSLPTKHSKPRRDEMRCWACGKLGHFSHECFSGGRISHH